jgi:hypothetical protein
VIVFNPPYPQGATRYPGWIRELPKFASEDQMAEMTKTWSEAGKEPFMGLGRLISDGDKIDET